MSTRTITLSADQWQVISSALSDYLSEGPPGEGWHDAGLVAAIAAFDTTLAQPEAEGPTDEEINDLADEWWPMDRVDVCDFARAALARWGSASFTPIPSDETTPMRTVEHDGRSYLVPAQPEPVGPTDEEINDLYWATATAHPVRENIAVHIAGLRAVLQCYAHPTPQPIPVSERLPSDQDSDANGRVWAWNPEALWWDYWQPKFIRMNAGDPYTHWLPGDALPLPCTTTADA